MTTIRLVNLTKRFGDLIAVNRVNMEIKHGELTCILGPSGSGKTTMMRMIAGLETPTEGDIYFDEERVTELPPAERDVAMVFQFPAVYPSLTVYENIAVPLRAEKLSKDEIRRKVMWAAELLGLKEYLNYRYNQLDMGVLQRVSIAKAIVRSSRVFIFDEPLSNLDAKVREVLRVHIKKIHAELGQTMIYVTHDQLDAMSLADRIAILRNGILQQFDTPENIYHHPANKFVAFFIGSPSINFIDATVRVTEKDAYAEIGGQKLDLTKIRSILAEKIGEMSREFTLGIRPQFIDVSLEEKPGALKAVVEVIESMGATTLLEVKVDDVTIRALWDGVFPKSEGAEVWLTVDPNHVRLIDKKTEKVIL
ncbi:MAG: sugar ABC transporter ATP-binding protein [Thaumarchaeota archaeon]|nr:MAG: sugar ABC transporter ATP-binding protein [Nitrososphaerota archaeon]HDD40059.1 ABC transporter ATP-binding protein [Nitrososphaeria archaeon]